MACSINAYENKMHLFLLQISNYLYSLENDSIIYVSKEYVQLAVCISEIFYSVYYLKMNVNLKHPKDIFLSYFNFSDERMNILIWPLLTI